MPDYACKHPLLPNDLREVSGGGACGCQCLPGGATPHLNKNATKERYTHESEYRGKGGNVHMEQNWEEKESCE